MAACIGAAIGLVGDLLNARRGAAPDAHVAEPWENEASAGRRCCSVLLIFQC